MSNEIAKRILEHFRNGGTLDDSKIAALYRLAHGLAPDTSTDIKVVGRWAFDAATHLHLNAAGWNEAMRAGSPKPPRNRPD
jgi:hypothetical protein